MLLLQENNLFKRRKSSQSVISVASSFKLFSCSVCIYIFSFMSDTPVILSWKTNYSSNLQNSTSLSCIASYALNITWYRDNRPIKHGQRYVIQEGDLADKKVSFLKVKDADCQLAGKYTCVASNEYGSNQRQSTLTIIGTFMV